jgi:hypothetical protein
MLAIDPALFGDIQGSTDTEVVFHLALTFGLEEDPIQALEATVGLIEETAGDRGIPGAVQASFGVSDGAYGQCGTRPRAPRGHCSPRPMWNRSGACIPTTRASNGSAPTID